MYEVHTLEDGAQTADAVAERLTGWLGEASQTLDLALYDVRLPGPAGEAVAEALRAAMRRGVRVRLAFNDDSPGPDTRPFEPPPPSTQPHILEELGAELRPIPGWRDLMHPKGLRPPPSVASQTDTPQNGSGTAPRCGPDRRTGRWTRGRARRT